MKLTKAQRHKIYKATLQSIDSMTGICCHLAHHTFGDSYKIHVYRYFPEFLIHKPADAQKSDYWFGWPTEETLKYRKKVLRACIRETAPKKRK